MGLKYLWDTNIVIYFLQQQFPPDAEKIIDKVISESQPAISAITEIELLCWKTTNDNDIEIVKKFISDSIIIELEQPIKNLTSQIKKNNKIKLPDAIIASTSIINNLTLITRNVEDFRSIAGLKILNPFDL